MIRWVPLSMPGGTLTLIFFFSRSRPSPLQVGQASAKNSFIPWQRGQVVVI